MAVVEPRPFGPIRGALAEEPGTTYGAISPLQAAQGYLAEDPAFDYPAWLSLLPVKVERETGAMSPTLPASWRFMGQIGLGILGDLLPAAESEATGEISPAVPPITRRWANNFMDLLEASKTATAPEDISPAAALSIVGPMAGSSLMSVPRGAVAAMGAKAAKPFSLTPEVDALGFFSPTLEAVKKLKATGGQKKGTPQQMQAQLVKAGAKPKELEAMGFDAAFGQSPTVTLDEVETWARENRIRPQARVVSDRNDELINEAEEAFESDLWEAGDLKEYVDEETGETVMEVFGDEIYRGPDEGEGYDAARERMWDVARQDFETEAAGRRLGMDIAPQWESYFPPGGGDYAERLFSIPSLNDTYKGTHWNTPGVFAHQRTKSYTVPLPKPPEIEAATLDLAPRMAEVRREIDALNENKWAGGVTAENADEFRAVNEEITRKYKELMDLQQRTRAPTEQVHFVGEMQSDWSKNLRTQGGARSEAELLELNRLLNEAHDAYQEARGQARAFMAQHSIPDPYGNLSESLNEWAERGDWPSGEQIASEVEKRFADPDYVPPPPPPPVPELADEARRLAGLIQERHLPYQERQMAFTTATRGVPTGPYVRTTQDWLDFSIRKALIDAVAEDADRVVFTRGADIQDVSGGEIAGQEAFYDVMVPQRLKKVLKEIDPEVSIEEVGAPHRRPVVADERIGRPLEVVEHPRRSGYYTIKLADEDSTYGIFDTAEDAARHLPELQRQFDEANKYISVKLTPELREKIKGGLSLFVNEPKSAATISATGEVARNLPERRSMAVPFDEATGLWGSLGAGSDDFRALDMGSTVALHPTTPEAKAWADQNLGQVRFRGRYLVPKDAIERVSADMSRAGLVMANDPMAMAATAAGVEAVRAYHDAPFGLAAP